MRIGMLAPISHPYPPPGYGPWERVTSDLSESLVTAGHEVVLFAAATSRTAAHLISTVPVTLDEIPAARRRDTEQHHIDTALTAAADLELDVLHSHLHVHVLERSHRLRVPIVSTLHGVASSRDVHPMLRRHADSAFVSLSDSERDFLPELNYVATVANGIRTEDFPAGTGGDRYVLFVGRIAPEKAPHLAVEAARSAGFELLLAGGIDEKNRAYADQVLGELGQDARYLGPVGREELADLLSGAHATIMPLQWDEPFGLVVVESMAAGTPVVAWTRGAMPEIIEDGVTGFLVENVHQAVAALRQVYRLSRTDCTRTAKRRFDRTVMAGAYLGVYEREIATASHRAGHQRL
jgi:glycosyltransferase involved in cell wall biosynthesis